jgi:predicted deacetylase
MQTKYLIRLDDACPTMDAQKWQRVEDILDKYGIKPMVGIIPHNEDQQQEIEAEDPAFWAKAKAWENKSWAIALHGYTHCYISDKGLNGLNPMWSRSEFAGVTLNEQRQKIKDGVHTLKIHGLNPKYFFAPSHTFDNNTLVALKTESDIRVISDTVSLRPYNQNGFLFIPQIVGHCTKMPLPGIYTFCLHPSTMTDASYGALESFLQQYSNSFTDFESVCRTQYANKAILDKFISWLFFTQRKLRGLR